MQMKEIKEEEGEHKQLSLQHMKTRVSMMTGDDLKASAASYRDLLI